MPWNEDALDQLQDRLGHRFANRALLTRALSHRSGVSEAADSNERLEFLGDRVLGLCIAELVFAGFPDEPEGVLNKRLVSAVRAETCAEVAAELDLGALLLLDKGESAQGGRQNPSLLADACEAVIAALYLDGGLEVARAFVRGHWVERLDRVARPGRDAKTELQEWAQGRGLPLPAYVEIGRAGPDHAPSFVVEVTVQGIEPARGEGRTKRDAQQRAAANLLQRIGVDDGTGQN